MLLLLKPLFIEAQTLKESLHLNLDDGLKQNTVTCLKEDSLGRIWMGTPSGLNLYNGYNVNEIPEIGEYVLALHLVDSNIFCLGLKRIYKINIYTFSTKSYSFKEAEYYQHRFTSSGIIILNPVNKDTIYLNYALEPCLKTEADTIPFSFSSFKLKIESHTVEGTSDGLVLIKGNDSTVLSTAFSQKGVLYSPTRAFLSTYEGVLELNVNGDSIQIQSHYTHYRIEDVLIDSEKNLWISTAENGVFLVHRNTLNSQFFEKSDKDGEQLCCWNFVKLNSGIHVCTTEGLKAVDNTSNENNPIPQLTKNLNCISAYNAQDFVLIGSLNSGIYKLENEKVSRVYFNKKQALDNTIIQIQPYKTGFIASSKKAFIYLNKKGEFVKRVAFDFEEPKTYIMDLKPHDSGFVAATTNGLYFFNDSLKWTKHPTQNTSVFSMLEFNNDIWITGLGEGLFKYKKDRLLSVDFPDKHLYSVKKDNHQNYWITSTSSLYKYSGDSIFPYTSENGFPIKEYNQAGVFKDSSYLYFAGMGGVQKINPKHFNSSTKLPSVIVKRKNGLLKQQSSLALNYAQAEINLDIEIIDVSDRNHYRISYQYEDSSKELLTEKSIQIEPPFGESDFTILIENIATAKTYKQFWPIYRSFPFWKKNWFIALSFLAALILLLGVYSLVRYLQTRKLLKSEREEKKITEERLRISKELHDNIGSRITHIISSLDIEMYQRKDEIGAIENINSFARETMTQLRETIWMVNEKAIFFSEFFIRITQYIDQINELSNASISAYSESIPDFELGPIQTINYYRIVQEAMNNSLKYAEATEIEVKALKATDQKKIELIISDNGKGFNTQTTKGGTGITGMKERTQEAGGIIKVNSSNNGTIISILIPIIG